MTGSLSGSLRTHDRVRVVAIRDDGFAALPIYYKRHPEVGDVAAIVDTHQAEYVYEVECSDPRSCETLWLDAMYVDELASCPE